MTGAVGLGREVASFPGSYWIESQDLGTRLGREGVGKYASSPYVFYRSWFEDSEGSCTSPQHWQQCLAVLFFFPPPCIIHVMMMGSLGPELIVGQSVVKLIHVDC